MTSDPRYDSVAVAITVNLPVGQQVAPEVVGTIKLNDYYQCDCICLNIVHVLPV